MGIVQDLTGVDISAMAGRTGIYRTEEFYSIIRKGLLGNSRYIKWGSVAVTGPDGSAFELLIYAPSDSTLHNLKWILRKITAGATDEEPDTETWEFVCTTTTAKVQEVLAAHGLEKSIITGAGFATPAAPAGGVAELLLQERNASKGRAVASNAWIETTSATSWTFGGTSSIMGNLIFPNFNFPAGSEIVRAELWMKAMASAIGNLYIPTGARRSDAAVLGKTPAQHYAYIAVADAIANQTAMKATWTTVETGVTRKADVTAAIRAMFAATDWNQGAANDVMIYFNEQLTGTAISKTIAFLDGSKPILKVWYREG